MIDRILGVALIFVATLVPPAYFEMVTHADVQLVLGTLVVLYIILGDAIAGLLMGIAVFIMYFQGYSYKFGVSWYDVLTNPGDMASQKRQQNYTTAEDLQRAQSNVVDSTNAKIEMKGIEGVYGEEVYGAQGMDRTMPAYDDAVKFQSLADE